MKKMRKFTNILAGVGIICAMFAAISCSDAADWTESQEAKFVASGAGAAGDVGADSESLRMYVPGSFIVYDEEKEVNKIYDGSVIDWKIYGIKADALPDDFDTIVVTVSGVSDPVYNQMSLRNYSWGDIGELKYFVDGSDKAFKTDKDTDGNEFWVLNPAGFENTEVTIPLTEDQVSNLKSNGIGFTGHAYTISKIELKKTK